MSAEIETPPVVLAPVVLALEGVSHAYEEAGSRHPILVDTSVEVRAGQFVVLLGRSGSGKSTLLHLLSGIDIPDAGTIRVRDQEITQLPESRRTEIRRDHIGLVFQSFNLVPTLTVLENVLLRPELKGVRGATERAKQLLDDVGLATRADAFPDRLSGGEQQRVAIASALAHDPEIVLADEPTGNLDEETGDKVVRILDDLVRRENKTLVMATHSTEMIGVADRILRIEAGRLVESEAEARK
ncbi:MAG: ABC transporter ATP-binding protein [Planctomycetota bacterium]